MSLNDDENMRKLRIYEIGDKVGNCSFVKFTGVKIYGASKSRKRVAIFKCECGKDFESVVSAVESGNTKSCGCLNIKKIREQGYKNSKHGKREHRLYKTWQGMLRRCTSPNDRAYKNYGGRGINVCERWKNIDNFIEDMFPSYKEGSDIDRIDVNGNYEPGNCRWVTRKENMNNMRRNRLIEYKGVIKTISQWSDDLQIPYKRLISRLNKWDVEKSFTYNQS